MIIITEAQVFYFKSERREYQLKMILKPQIKILKTEWTLKRSMEISVSRNATKETSGESAKQGTRGNNVLQVRQNI